MSAGATSASILHDSVCKTEVNGKKSWRQLSSLKGMPPEDDDRVSNRAMVRLSLSIRSY